MTEAAFRRDLYRGAALDYDQFRLPYPRALTDDLARRTGADGSGRLADLACGTGQVSFALHGRFERTWAIDQEPDMITVARRKAEAAGLTSIEFATCPVEDWAAPPGGFDLIAVGNAFHRLRREHVADRALRWLRPGAFLALLWGGSPWEGDAPWQRQLAGAMRRWQEQVGGHDRVPAGYDQARAALPDSAVLERAGFQLTGRYEFQVAHEWTPDAITGFMFSTSVLSRVALGDLAGEFAADLAARLRACEPSGRLRQVMSFAYDLARRPR